MTIFYNHYLIILYLHVQYKLSLFPIYSCILIKNVSKEKITMTNLKTDFIEMWKLQKSRFGAIIGTILTVDIVAFIFQVDIFIPMSWDILLILFLFAVFIFIDTSRHLKEISFFSKFLFSFLYYLIVTVFLEITDFLFMGLFKS